MIGKAIDQTKPIASGECSGPGAGSMLHRAHLRAALARSMGEAITPEVALSIEADACGPAWPTALGEKTAEFVDATLRAAFKGDEAAVDFVRQLTVIVHLWDDLIDRDKQPASDTINAAFSSALLGFNFNPFFQRHSAMLSPVLLTGILSWHAANDMERSGGQHPRELAWAIRCNVGDVALMAAYLIGGMDHARAHAASLRLLMQQDALADYLKELTHD